MRIRKNANPASLRFSSFEQQVCQLNQSRWDVISLSPSKQLAPGNGKAAEERLESMKKPDFIMVETEVEGKVEADFGSKQDTKKLKISEVQNDSRGKARCGGEASVTLSADKSMTRSGSSSRYGYLYYSGFGPGWGKPRGDKSTRNYRVDGGGAGYEDNTNEGNSGVKSKRPTIYEIDKEEDFGFLDLFGDNEKDNGCGKRKKKKMKSLKSLM